MMPSAPRSPLIVTGSASVDDCNVNRHDCVAVPIENGVFARQVLRQPHSVIDSQPVLVGIDVASSEGYGRLRRLTSRQNSYPLAKLRFETTRAAVELTANRQSHQTREARARALCLVFREKGAANAILLAVRARAGQIGPSTRLPDVRKSTRRLR